MLYTVAFPIKTLVSMNGLIILCFYLSFWRNVSKNYKVKIGLFVQMSVIASRSPKWKGMEMTAVFLLSNYYFFVPPTQL
jgi:hypothetical protein